MKYAILEFSIFYNEKPTYHGICPYRGVDLSNDSLLHFVQSYFTGLDKYSKIEVKAKEEFEDSNIWLNIVKDMDEFKYLRQVNNFAGELGKSK